MMRVACNTAYMSRYYAGPKSDHFDGERFFDQKGRYPKADAICCVGT
jgi:hypothetical protein